jgi:hypothetical protein
MSFVLREECFGFLVIDAGMDNYILALLPIHWGRNSMFVTQLDCIDGSQNLVLSDVNQELVQMISLKANSQNCARPLQGTIM